MANFYQGYEDFQPLVDAARHKVLPSATGYSLANRLKGGLYDCSSFASTALSKLPGFDYIKPHFTTWNYNPRNPHNAFAGRNDWQWVNGAETAMPGDILWRNGHMEIATGNGWTIGAHSKDSGVSEYRKQPYNTFTGYWRYTGDQSRFRQPSQTVQQAPVQASANPQAGQAQGPQAQPSPNIITVAMPMAMEQPERGFQGYVPQPRPMVHSRASAELLNRFLGQLQGYSQGLI